MRFKEGVEGPDGVEVLLISSNSGKRPVFPKGGWEQDEELREAALRETLEEAGVRGTLEEPLIGKFPFLSAKAPAQRTQMTHGGRCMAYLFVMHVSEVLEVWPEAKQRKREWVSLDTASLSRPGRGHGMRACMASAPQLMGAHSPPASTK